LAELSTDCFGVDLRRGDMLQLGSGAQATVLCADLTALPVPAGAPSGAINNCPPQAKPAIIRKEAQWGQPKRPLIL